MTPDMDNALSATFQKSYTPTGYKIVPYNFSIIEGFEDCRVMRDEDGTPLGVEVETTEGTLEVGVGEAWIFEDSEGEHYPISNEAVEQMYTPIAIHEKKK